jgi:hypothetical protein
MNEVQILRPASYWLQAFAAVRFPRAVVGGGKIAMSNEGKIAVAEKYFDKQLETPSHVSQAMAKPI